MTSRKTWMVRASKALVIHHLRRQDRVMVLMAGGSIAGGAVVALRGGGMWTAIGLLMLGAWGVVEVIGRERPPGEGASAQRLSAWLRKWTRLEFDGRNLRYHWGWKQGEDTCYPVDEIRDIRVVGRRVVLSMKTRRWRHGILPPSIPTRFYEPDKVAKLVAAVQEEIARRR